MSNIYGHLPKLLHSIFTNRKNHKHLNKLTNVHLANFYHMGMIFSWAYWTLVSDTTEKTRICIFCFNLKMLGIMSNILFVWT